MSEACSQPPSSPPIRTHLVLVHDQLIPNILPALDEHFRPCHVCLLSAPHFARQSERLTAILKESGVTVSSWPIDDPWDLDHVRERVRALLTDPTLALLALNASGGPLPMCLAAYEVFQQADLPIYHVHPETDHVVWLHPAGQPSFNLADRLRLDAFFRAQDLRLVSANRQGINESLRALTATLAAQTKQYAAGLGTLNWLASTAEERNSLVSPVLTTEQLRDPHLAELLQLFGAQGVLTVDAGQRVVFSNPSARFYVNGGWLEEHVFGVVSNLRQEFPLIQDLGRSLTVIWDEKVSTVKNEIDVAFLANNRLYLIECKTKRYDRDDSPEAQIAATLYKLDTLRDYFGGKTARAMLVSYRTLEPRALQRAQEYGIAVCDGAKINKLGEVLKKWICH